MATRNRDEFSAATKRLLAQRAGYRCSFPGCPTPQTIGAAKGHCGVVNLGIAAHIAAAAPGGKRYDQTLTPVQRKSANNGIWCCANHGKAIDDDEESFEVATLKAWKEAAETASLPHVWTKAAKPGPLIEPELDVPEAEALATLGLPPETDLAATTARLIEIALADLEAFQRDGNWPVHPVYLGLRLRDKTLRFDARQIAAAAEAHRTIIVVAPPGVGKSTTLLQMAAEIAACGNFVALFIALPEWSAQGEGFLRSVLGRHAFNNVREGELRLLAHFGRLVLFLDGWNELDAGSRRRATEEINQLRRDYPELGIVLSTRQQAMGLPVVGPIVEIEPLDEDQQREIARTLLPDHGEALLELAWETAGVDELVGIPLYLRALLANADAGSFPTTKEGVLRLFVNEHDTARRKAQALDDVTMGFHTQILTGLAVEATRSANTSIPVAVANQVVSGEEQILVEQGQITVRPQPRDVLTALAGQHALIVPTATTYAFQHQQFQEWYASFEVEKTMRAAASGDIASRQALLTDIIDLPQWEEAILFACDRCSRQDDEGVAAVASAILETLGIDPFLAAEMIYRSAPAVWERIRPQAQEFAAQWAGSGRGDRALSFMVRTGRPEFAETIWPLLADPNTQTNMQALRASPTFRTSVLGPDIRSRAAALPEQQRIELLSELAFHGSRDVMILAAELAANDRSAAVRSSVAEFLIRRRAEGQALMVLQQSPLEVWQALANKGFADEFRDEGARDRMRALRVASIGNATADRRLDAILYAPVDDGHIPEIQAIIEDPDLPLRGMDLRRAMGQLNGQYPGVVAESLLHRLEKSLQLPFGTDRILRDSGLVVDHGPLVDGIATGDAPGWMIKDAGPVLGAEPVGLLIEQRVAMSVAIRHGPKGPILKPDSDRLNELDLAVRNAPVESIAHALLGRAPPGDVQEIATLADTLAGHSDGRASRKLELPSDLHTPILGMVADWARRLLGAPERNRSDMANVARAIGRVGDPELLPLLEALLSDDHVRQREAQAAYQREPTIDSDFRTSWTNWYRDAFVAIGEPAVEPLLRHLDDPQFGADSASALSQIWGNRAPPPEEETSFFGRQNYAQVRRRRLERQASPDPDGLRFSDAIFAAAERRLAEAADLPTAIAAINLARFGYELPFTDRAEFLDRVMASPASTDTKLRLLTTLVLSGGTVSAGHLLQGLREFLALAETKTWMIEERRGELEDWLALFPFSDNPEAVVEAFADVPVLHRGVHRLERALVALGATPDDRAGRILHRLAREVPEVMNGHAWIDALASRPSVEAARVILDLAIEGALPKDHLQFNTKAQHVMAGAVNCEPAFRAKLYDRYRAVLPGALKDFMAHVIAEVPDDDAILELVNADAESGRPFGGPLQLALDNITRRQEPGGGGTYYIYSQPLPETRKRLFARTADRSHGAMLARLSLEMIDHMRDMYGPVESEPRHPDIASGRPWPILNQ